MKERGAVAWKRPAEAGDNGAVHKRYDEFIFTIIYNIEYNKCLVSCCSSFSEKKTQLIFRTSITAGELIQIRCLGILEY